MFDKKRSKLDSSTLKAYLTNKVGSNMSAQLTTLEKQKI